MSDDLTARLEEAIRDFRPPIIGPSRWALAARLAEVVLGPTDADFDAMDEEYRTRIGWRLLKAERDRDEAVRAAQEMSEKLDARINVGAERDEAVRLLEVCPVGQRAVPGQFVVRATGGVFMPSLAEWEKERRAFLARHKEAQK